MTPTADSGRLVDELREEAARLGFTLFGVTRPEPSEHMAFYDAWLANDRHGEMAYLARDDARARRAEPATSFPGAGSVIVVGHEYGSGPPTESDAVPTQSSSPSTQSDSSHHHGDAVIARYARGTDYHHVIPARLERLLAWLDKRVEGGVRGRPLVDTAPVLERELAGRAGLGWFGRNTMLINPGKGSYFLLGLLMVDVALDATAPFEHDRCGTCDACLVACPTDALLGRDESGAPVMDARRCISYLTIELKGPIPRDLRPGIGSRVFGCDICQEVCPWNQRFGASNGDPAYAADGSPDTLEDLTARLLELSEKAYQRTYAGSPLARPRRKGMLRNLLVGIGNALGDPGYGSEQRANAVRLLAAALLDRQPLVRGHAVWALGQAAHAVGPASGEGSRIMNMLREHARTESDTFVLDEVEQAVAEA